MRDGGGVEFFVELCAAVILDAVFDAGDDEDEENGKGGRRGRGGSEDGKDCNALGRLSVDRDALTLEYDKSQKVDVGYSVKHRQCQWP